MIRGEIWWVDLDGPLGSEPGFKRPVVVIQDDSFNKSNIQTVNGMRIILLAGGKKFTQNKDIRKAQELARLVEE